MVGSKNDPRDGSRVGAREDSQDTETAQNVFNKNKIIRNKIFNFHYQVYDDITNGFSSELPSVYSTFI